MHDSLLPHWNAWIERRDRVLSIANSVTEDALLFQSSKDDWSIKDVMQHLQVVDFGFARSAQKRLPTLLEKDPVGPEAEENMQLLASRLRSMGKFDSPEGVNPSLMNDAIGWHKLEQRWARTGVLWVQIMSDIPAEALDRPIARHPFSGYMRPDQFLRWNCAHYDNHTAQIEETQRIFAERNSV